MVFRRGANRPRVFNPSSLSPEKARAQQTEKGVRREEKKERKERERERNERNRTKQKAAKRGKEIKKNREGK